jgi:hypothetical protein
MQHAALARARDGRPRTPQSSQSPSSPVPAPDEAPNLPSNPATRPRKRKRDKRTSENRNRNTYPTLPVHLSHALHAGGAAAKCKSQITTCTWDEVIGELGTLAWLRACLRYSGRICYGCYWYYRYTYLPTAAAACARGQRLARERRSVVP